MTADQLVHLLAVQTLQVAVVVSATLVVTTTLLRRRPHLAYALWLAALAKCLMPPVWSSPTGVFSWAGAERRTPVVVEPAPPAMADRPRATPVAAEAATPVLAADVGRPGPTPVRWPAVVIGTWLAGAGVVLVVTGVASGRLRRRVRRSTVDVPPEVAAAAADVRRSLGLRRRVRLVTTEADVGPALLGTFFPTVVLPRRLAAADVRPVLGHELAHVRRGDAVVAAGQRLAVALWWFHPLVWVASRRLTAAREQCCDEETVAGLGLDPAAYAQTLLDVARRCRRARTLALYPGLDAMHLTKSRLNHMMHAGRPFRRRPGKRAWLVLGLAAVVLLPGAGLAVRRPTSAPAASGPASAKAPPSPAVAGSVTSADASHPWRVKLPGGVDVELVGLSENPSDTAAWWEPDGAALAGRPYTHLTASTGADPLRVHREAAARLAGSAAKGVDCQWQFDPAAASTAVGSMLADGPTDGLVAVAVTLPGDTADATVRLGVASGPWTAVAEGDPHGSSSTAAGNGHSYLFAPPTEDRDDLAVTVAHDDTTDDVRLVAVTNDGTEHTASTMSTGAGTLRQMTGTFAGVKRSDVKQFEVQSRAYEWAEFKHVRLRPNP